jgi:aldose 1-epimerase
MAVVAPSGQQFEIAYGDQRATVVEVGGGIREYAVGGRPVLEPYAVDRMCDGAHGAPLVPWPNRLDGGRYRFDGVDHQLPLSEPDKGNAIHGLLRWQPWRAHGHTRDRVVMATRLHPRPGYPFTLDVRIDYRLDDTGLRVSTSAANIGATTCLYGSGQHPYLSPGGGVIDDAELEIAAGLRVVTDAERQLPVGVESVPGGRYDFRTARRLGGLAIDHAFTDLARDEAGRAWVRLRGPDGRTAELWVDGGYPYLELFTGDTLAPPRRRHGLGCEPMTCPPNAFATGADLIRLAPGQQVTTVWGAGLR